jgi:hypothetical protein
MNKLNLLLKSFCEQIKNYNLANNNEYLDVFQ